MYFRNARNKTAEFPRVYPARSQLLFRLSLAYKRSMLYPMDSMDFIMADLEQPEGYVRAADGCVGDLTGRCLDFWNMCRLVNLPGFNEERYRELVRRMLATRNEKGGLASLSGGRGQERSVPPGAGFSCAVVPGIVGCYEQTGLDEVKDAIDSYRKWVLENIGEIARTGQDYSGHSLGYLYEYSADPELLDAARRIGENCVKQLEEQNCFHTHGFLHTMVGLLEMAILTGDRNLAEVPERFRRLILEHAELAGGDICEFYPYSILNEGCSISDWLRTNLLTGLLTGDRSAYEAAENTLWNALLFNQSNNGGFGHRMVGKYGYPGGRYVEAWWCCLHNAGRTICECFLNAVTLRRSDGAVCVNFLLPGRYVFGDAGIAVEITTDYPYAASAVIRATGMGDGRELQVRVPAAIRGAKLDITRDGDAVTARLEGKIGYTLTAEDGGCVLRYGPMVMAPCILGFEPDLYRDNAKLAGIFTDVKWESGAPARHSRGRMKLLLPEADADGFLPLEFAGFRRWTYADEGALCQDAKGCASTYVKVMLPDGKTGEFCFYPLNYYTRGSSFGDIVTVFDA